MNRNKLILLAAEIAAIALLRTIYVMRREKLPKGGKVTIINGHRVFRMPFSAGSQQKQVLEPIWVPPPRNETAPDK